jgi:hypothetical protein
MKTFKKFTIKYLFILFIFLLSSIFKSAAQADQIPIPISKDTYVEENFPTVSPWNNKNIYIGRDLYYNKGKTRAYFKFKLDQLKALEIKR